MKGFGIAGLLLANFTLIGCGSSKSSNSTSSVVDGRWNASLVGGNSSIAYQFGTSLSTDSKGILTISNFDLRTDSPCFADGEPETGSVTLGGDLLPCRSGQFSMVIQSNPPSGNTLALSGMHKGNAISGVWTLTGSTGCTGSGKFMMTKI